jgi:hypothetical protein
MQDIVGMTNDRKMADVFGSVVGSLNKKRDTVKYEKGKTKYLPRNGLEKGEEWIYKTRAPRKDVRKAQYRLCAIGAATGPTVRATRR